MLVLKIGTLVLKITPIFTFLDILIDYSDIFVSIRACVLVPKTKNVTKLMDYDAKIVTILSNRDTLLTIPPSAHKRAATRLGKDKQLLK